MGERGIGAFAHDAAEGCDQFGCGGTKFIVMMQGEFAEDFLASGREGEEDFAAIVLGAGAMDKASGFEAIDQFDGAVVADLHAIGQFADAGAHTGGHPFHGEHELILAAFEAGLLHHFLAKVEEAADLVTELGQRLVVR